MSFGFVGSVLFENNKYLLDVFTRLRQLFNSLADFFESAACLDSTKTRF
jgi:hypothetical protein